MFVDLKNLNLNDDKVFGIFLSVRLLSVLLVQTFYVPDEYWQSLEIAHKLTYGYGYKTWEWTYGIRSYIHPLTISIFYKVVQLLGVDYTEVLVSKFLKNIDLCIINFLCCRFICLVYCKLY